MKATVRCKLDMVSRVLDLLETAPATDPSYQTVLAQLRDRYARASMLVAQQQSGTTGERAAIANRDDAQRLIRAQLKHLTHVGARAARTDAALAGLYRTPPFHAPILAFVGTAKLMLSNAMLHAQQLIDAGLGIAFLDELTANIAAFDGFGEGSHASRGAHVGARADLVAVSSECVELVTILNGLNQARFRDNAGLLAEWNGARIVIRGRRRRDADMSNAAEGEPAAGAGTSGGGEVG